MYAYRGLTATVQIYVFQIILNLNKFGREFRKSNLK